MDKKYAEDEPPSILQIADRALAEARLSRGSEAVSKCVLEVFTAVDPDARFVELARAYIGNQGSDTRARCVTELAWAFGAKRQDLKKLLRLKGIVGERD